MLCIAGSNFQKHKEDMMKMLSDDRKITPISVEITPSVTSTRTYSSHSSSSTRGSISPHGVIVV